MTKIIVDVYGGDYAPKEILDGCVAALQEESELSLVLFGEKNEIKGYFDTLNDSNINERIEIVDAPEVISNEEAPTEAVRRRPDSSLVKSMRRLKEDDTCEGFISAGSTGAVLVGATLIAGRIRGINRPALAPLLPTVTGEHVILIDCGANIECKDINLLQFAQMGKAYALCNGVENPRIGLLSNGAEDHKGTTLNQEAFKLLKEDKTLNFLGNCEARDILSGNYDVVVSDGFNGNIALKSAEGTANAVFSLLKDGIMKGGLRAKLGYLLLKPTFKDLKHKVDYNENGGACFLGVNKVIVKAHGASKAKSIKAALLQCSGLIKSDVVGKIKESISIAE